MGLDRRMKRELAHTKKKLHEREMRMFKDMTPEQIIKHIQYVNARHKSNVNEKVNDNTTDEV